MGLKKKIKGINELLEYSNAGIYLKYDKDCDEVLLTTGDDSTSVPSQLISEVSIHGIRDFLLDFYWLVKNKTTDRITLMLEDMD